MAATHTVKQGEYLSMIAKQYGFATHITLWDHEKNKDLKEKRKNPNVLFIGDEIFIPDKEIKQIDVRTEQLTKFTVKRDKLKLRFAVEDLYGGPLSDVEFELKVDDKLQKVEVKGNGKIEATIPADAKEAELTIKNTKGESGDIKLPMKVGHLDPATEKSGQIARLNNLGYFAGPFDDGEEKKDEEGLSEEEKAKKAKEKEENEMMFKSAVEEFQCDHKLTVDGKCGPKTQAKLEEVHGC